VLSIVAAAHSLVGRAMRGTLHDPDEATILTEHVIDAALAGDEYEPLPHF